jgi:hypothetical protein
MRNFTGDVMQNVSLRDTIGCMGPNPAHDASKISKKITVQGRKSTSDECELRRTVVRKKRVGVLQKGNQHKPVINPKVWHEISLEYCEGTPLIDAKGDSGKPKKNSESRDHDLTILMGSEHRRRRIEIWR